MKRDGRKPLALVLAALLFGGVVAVAVWTVLLTDSADESATAQISPELRRNLEAAHDAAYHYVLKGEIEKAKPIVQHLLREYPNDAEAHRLASQIALQEGSGAKAYEHVRQSLELDPTQHDLHFLAGSLAQKQDLLDEARAHYTRATELRPNEPKYAIYLGQLLLKVGRLDQAQMELLRALKLDSSLPEAHSVLAEVSARRGKLNMAMGQVNRAIEHTEPDSAKRLRFVLQKAALLRRANQPQVALELLQSLGEEQRYKPGAVQQIATTYQMMNRQDAAADAWVDLYERDPGNAQAAAEAGLCYLKDGNLRLAHRYLQLARQVDSQADPVKNLEAALNKALAERSAEPPASNAG